MVQNAAWGPSEPTNRIKPKTSTASDPPTPATVRTAPDHRELPTPPRRMASSRDPTASAARAETVMAVPSAMANVAKTPAHSSPCDSANPRTKIAPVHGRMPTAKARPRARVQDQSPTSWLGSGKWA